MGKTGAHCTGYSSESTADPVQSLLGNYDETVYSVRGALVRYSSCITVRFKTTEDVSSQLLRLADELLQRNIPTAL